MPATETTRLLSAARTGDADALDRLFPQIYEELKAIASRALRRHGGSHTLQTTALVHEAYVKLVGQADIQPQDRAHFLALASRAMRFILIDHARARTAKKRGGRMEPVALDDVQVVVEGQAIELLDLNTAVERLARQEPRLAELVDCRFFGGLTHEEVATVTGRSVPTVKRDWRRARAWLYREMRAGGEVEREGGSDGGREARRER